MYIALGIHNIFAHTHTHTHTHTQSSHINIVVPSTVRNPNYLTLLITCMYIHFQLLWEVNCLLLQSLIEKDVASSTSLPPAISLPYRISTQSQPLQSQASTYMCMTYIPCSVYTYMVEVKYHSRGQ